MSTTRLLSSRFVLLRGWIKSESVVELNLLSNDLTKCISRKMSFHNLTPDNINPRLKTVEHVLRGPLLIRAAEIEKELEKDTKRAFKEVIKASIGDCHAVGQAPITFMRQILALVSYPKLLDDPQFSADAKQRAKTILAGCRGGSAGSYTEASGIEVIRRHIAEYIEKRDGIPSHWQNIILSQGASDAVMKVLRLFICDIDGKRSGVMVPTPHDPLYSASLAEFNLQQINYFLDESKGWELDVSELQRAIDEAKGVSVPRAIVVINPGNPTGQVLSRKNIEEIIKFAYKEKLFLLADEIYQDNMYIEDAKFCSFKKVLTEMGKPYSDMELASFMSCSKGYLGECGLRGGYVEVINMNAEVRTMYLKAISAMLCPTVLGQAAIGVMAKPPQKGEPSYEQFTKEKNDVLDSLKLKSKMVADAFNSFERIKCNLIQAGMHAFPQVTLPPKAVDAAKKQNKTPDEFYALELLENTGICILPGSDFGQEPGTYHLCVSILPPTDKLKYMLDKFKEFHTHFLRKYI